MTDTTATQARKFFVIFEREAPMFHSRVEELRPGHVSEDLAYWTSRIDTALYGIRIDTVAANGTITESHLAA